MMDPRPVCRFCARRWTPREGQDATTSFCRACLPARRRASSGTFEKQGKVLRQVGKHQVRVAKNA